jgi:hypothetical protein
VLQLRAFNSPGGVVEFVSECIGKKLGRFTNELTVERFAACAMLQALRCS